MIQIVKIILLDIKHLVLSIHFEYIQNNIKIKMNKESTSTYL